MILCLVGRRNNDHAWYAGLVEFDIAGLVVWMSFFLLTGLEVAVEVAVDGSVFGMSEDDH